MTTTINLTDRAINKLPPFTQPLNTKTRCAEYTDIALAGFKIQVYPNGKKYFLVRFTLNGRKGSMAIGEFPVIKTAEARERVIQIKAQVTRGEDPRAERKIMRAMSTFKEFADETYLGWADQHKRSANDDRAKLTQHIYKVFGNIALNMIVRADIESFLGSIFTSHCAATANRFRSLLSKIFSMAVENGLLKENPCTYVKKYSEPEFHPNSLNQDETRRLLEALNNSANSIAAAALKVLIFTGCRRDEILRATWENVDFAASTLYLPDTKSGRARYVPLNLAALAVLESIDRSSGSQWVFEGRKKGSPINDPRGTLWAALDAAGLPRIRIHDLRHGFATLAVNGGIDITSVQRLLGHSSINMTMRYAKVRDETTRTATNNIANLITGAAPPSK